jgi:hypothetical protein
MLEEPTLEELKAHIVKQNAELRAKRQEAARARIAMKALTSSDETARIASLVKSCIGTLKGISMQCEQLRERLERAVPSESSPTVTKEEP